MSIRVLIADDSSLARGLLRTLLEAEPDIEVVGEATDGHRAVELARALRPSLITMDLEMPHLDGLRAIEAIMSSKALPILVVSDVADAAKACEALRLGALDAIGKPDDSPAAAAAFLAKVRLLADTVVITRWPARGGPRVAVPQAPAEKLTCPDPTHAAHATQPLSERSDWLTVNFAWNSAAVRAFAIACSTGGPQALASILPALPGDFPVPILIAQHIADGFAAGLVEWLSGLSVLPVRLARDGERLQAGTVYLSPSEANLTLGPDERLALHADATGIYHPSGDALLASVAVACGPRAVGIVLTGMGSDGVAGLAAIRARGGKTLVQDEASSVIYGMNRVAIEQGLAEQIVPLTQIASWMQRLASGDNPPCRGTPPWLPR